MTNIVTNSSNQTRKYSSLFFLLFFCLSITSFALFTSNPYSIFTVTGFLAGAIVLLPLVLLRNINLISSWSFTILSVALGAVMRGIYIGIGYPDHYTLDFFYFLGSSPDSFIYPAIMLLLCLSFLVLGFIFAPGNWRKRPKAIYVQEMNVNRMYVFAILSLTISLIASVAYVNLTGGFDLLNLSKKRVLIESLELSNTHRTWQSLRVFSSIAILAHLLVLGNALQTNSSNKFLKLSLAASLFIVACLIPFYASSRGTIFLYFLYSLAMIYHMNQRLSWGKILAVMFLAIFIFQAMSTLRTSRDVSVTRVIRTTSLDFALLDRLVLNRNDFELAKTAHIINSTPNVLDYQYGKTIFVWLLAPIPREIWNSKPIISSGPIIGITIYGNRRSGVPPGMPGELYWNFGFPGMLIGAFLIGWLLRWIDWKFRPEPGDTLPKAVVFIYGPMSIGYLIIGTSIGFGIVTALVNTLLAVIVFRLMKIRH